MAEAGRGAADGAAEAGPGPRGGRFRARTLAADPDQAAPRWLRGAYHDDAAQIFPLAMGLAALSVATLGIYRFWERTRLRARIWSGVTLGGDPFEYVGTGLEKLLGFLIAVVVLGAALGLVQMGLFFAGLSLIGGVGPQGQVAASVLLAQSSLLLLVPLMFAARYRARRYLLGRTRWRGIRLGMAPGAWGYAWRGTLWLAATVLSLGLAWPWMRVALERYKADRTWFGDARLRLEGPATMLWPAFAWMPGLGAALAFGLAVSVPDRPGLAVLLAAAFVPALAVAYAHWRVAGFRRLVAGWRLGDAIRFESRLRTRRVLRHVVLGGALVVLLGGVVVGVLTGTVGQWAGVGGAAPTAIGLLFSMVGALAVFSVYGVLRLVLITLPILAATAETAQAGPEAALEGIRQRARDGVADADGFADALDLSGAL